jgi:hypothetical protein
MPASVVVIGLFCLCCLLNCASNHDFLSHCSCCHQMKVSHAPHACSPGSNDEHVQQTEGGEEAHVISFCSNTKELWSVTSSVPITGGHQLGAEFHSVASWPGDPTLSRTIASLFSSILRTGCPDRSGSYSFHHLMLPFLLNEYAFFSSVPPDKKSNANRLSWQEGQPDRLFCHAFVSEENL